MWLEQTGCQYDLLLDPNRKIYRAFGLGSSYAKVIKFGCLLQYSEFVVAGKGFPDIPHRLLEDIYQMGGDFLLDQGGQVLLSHPCETPLGRAALGDILQAATCTPAGTSADTAADAPGTGRSTSS